MISVMDGRQRAARAVTARRGELGMTQQGLADAAGVDIKTIGNLEKRGRWPIARNRALIEKALAWPLGELERIADSDDEPPLYPHVPPDVAAYVRRRWGHDPGEVAAVLADLEKVFSPRPAREQAPGEGGRESRRAV